MGRFRQPRRFKKRKIGMEDLMFIRPSSGIEGLKPVESNNIVGKNVKQYLNSGDPEKNLEGEFIQKTFKVR